MKKVSGRSAALMSSATEPPISSWNSVSFMPSCQRRPPITPASVVVCARSSGRSAKGLLPRKPSPPDASGCRAFKRSGRRATRQRKMYQRIRRKYQRRIMKRNTFRLMNAYHQPATVRCCTPSAPVAAYQVSTRSAVVPRQIT